MTAPPVDCEHLGFAYAAAAAGAFAIRDLSFAMRPSETLGVIGPNASGKTTLVRLLSKVVEPSSGRIRLDGADMARLSRAEVARHFLAPAPGPILAKLVSAGVVFCFNFGSRKLLLFTRF